LLISHLLFTYVPDQTDVVNEQCTGMNVSL